MIKDFVRDITAFGSLPFCLFAILLAYFLGATKLSILLFIALVLCYLISFPIKVLFFKQRPDKQGYSSLLGKFDAASFPSVHSMRAVSFGIVAGYSFESLAAAFFLGILALGIMYSRIELRKHYLTDVFWGAIFGVAVGAITLLIASFSLLAEFGLL